jgi:toxin ParE1/3/4
MDYEIVWTEPASAELKAITTYLAEHSSAAAERTASAIIQRVEQLKTVPLMGTLYPPASTSRIRKIVSGKYRIFYRVAEQAKQVVILTVWHGSRRDPDLPD